MALMSHVKFAVQLPVFCSSTPGLSWARIGQQVDVTVVDDVVVTVVVVVERRGAPAEGSAAEGADAGVLEGAVRLAEEPAGVLRRRTGGREDPEVGDEEVHVAVAVEVGEREAHQAAGLVGVSGNALVREVAGAVVLQVTDDAALLLRPRAGVLGTEVVDVAVLVDVDHRQRPGEGRVARRGAEVGHVEQALEAGLGADVLEGVAALVEEQVVLLVVGNPRSR